jgi:RNA polymerase sigma-32 factor
MARYIAEEPGLQRFVNTLEQFPVLEREGELELARRARAGDHRAADELVQAHLRSVVKMAQRYRGYGIYLSDLIAEGNLGLLEAVTRFDPDRGLRFLTYARYWIRAYMLAHILKHWSIVDLGTTTTQSKLFFRLQREHAKLTSELGADDDQIEERLADQFQTSVDNVRESLARLRRRDSSLDVPIAADSGTTFADLLTDDESPDQEQNVARNERVDRVHSAVATVWPTLECRERLIVRERLLPESDADPATLAALGERLGITRERVRQLEAAIKEKLRKTLLLPRIDRTGHDASLDFMGPARDVCDDCPAALCAA